MAGLETSKFLREGLGSDAIRRTTNSEWNVVLDILRYAEAGSSVRRDSDSVGNDTCYFVDILASERRCRHSLLTISSLGVFRRSFELRDLAVE